jgi:regulator of RNase E activity RraA
MGLDGTTIKPQAKVLADARGIVCVEVERPNHVASGSDGSPR